MSTNIQTPILPPWKDPAKIGLAIFTAFVFQLVILAGLSGKGLVPRITSDRVRFEVVPVDPRDMMRGEYIILGYEFSRLPDDVLLLDETIKSYKINQHSNLVMVLTSNALGEDGGLNQKEHRMCLSFLEIKTPRTSISSSRNGTCSPLPT